MTRRALICGISGQDGCYLAKLLVERGYEVWGSSRNTVAQDFAGLKRVGVFHSVRLVSLNLEDQHAVQQLLEQVLPQEVYLLAGQTSVGISFEQPVATVASIAGATLNMLESIRRVNREIRLFSAGSTECYGDTGESRATELSSLRPGSPYAVAKASAYWMISTYRLAYGLFGCTGILSNHESPLRPVRFVTRKVIRSVAMLMRGEDIRLSLGNLDVERDWGWAPEYVTAFPAMLERAEAQDYIIATGESHTLVEFIDAAFRLAGKNWLDFVTIDEKLMRPTDVKKIRVDPSKAAAGLGWRAEYAMPRVVALLLEEELAALAKGV